MEQPPSIKNMDNKPMEAEQVKKARGRPKKEPTEKTPKETKPKEAKPKAQPKAEKQPKGAKPEAQPKAEKQPKEAKPKKEKINTLDSERREILEAQRKVKLFKEAERRYMEALKGLNNPKPKAKAKT